VKVLMAVVAIPMYVLGLLTGLLVRPLHAGFMFGYFYFEAQEVTLFNDRLQTLERDE